MKNRTTGAKKLKTKVNKKEKKKRPWEPIIKNKSKGSISVVSMVTGLVNVNVQKSKTKMTKKKKQRKIITTTKIFMGYVTIVEEKSIGVEIEEIKKWL